MEKVIIALQTQQVRYIVSQQLYPLVRFLKNKWDTILQFYCGLAQAIISGYITLQTSSYLSLTKLRFFSFI